MQVKRDITGRIMSLGVIATSIFAIMHSNLTEVNMNEVTIVENGERNTITTEAETVLGLVTGGYVQIGNFDDVSVEMEDVVYNGMEIEITRAFPITINDGGTRFQTMARSSDVFEVLSQYEIELGHHDLTEIMMTGTNALGEEVQVNPTILTAFANSEVEVIVTRIHFETESSFEEFTLETVYIYTDDLLEGERVIQIAGSPKIEKTIVEFEYRNGELYEIVDTQTVVIDEGVAQVVAIGTYVYVPEPEPEPEPTPIVTQVASSTPAPQAPASNPTNNVNTGTPTPSLESFTANVTAYVATCDGCSGITANGTDVRSISTFYDASFGSVRILAADGRFPFGTIIYVSGIGKGVVLDRGGSVTGNVLDLLMGSYANPLQFGRQSLQAQVIRLGW